MKCKIQKGVPHCQHCCETNLDVLRVNSTRTSSDGNKCFGYLCRSCNTKRHKRYRSTVNGAERMCLAVARSINKYPEKQNARIKVRTAVQSGKLVKPSTCSVCRESRRIHGHHDDYSKPLEVRWVCIKCHADIHRNE